jgi:hypothetical protein
LIGFLQVGFTFLSNVAGSFGTDYLVTGIKEYGQMILLCTLMWLLQLKIMNNLNLDTINNIQ